MNELNKLFKKAGGGNLIRQYAKAHVLLYACVEACLLGFSRKSLEIFRLVMENKILSKLRKKYRKDIAAFVREEKLSADSPMESYFSDVIWVCWFQGLETAPEIVKKCYASLKKNIKNKKIVLITNDNYRDYVQFPDYIEAKHDKGIICQAHFADLLRLELLIRYGGTWIDSTVLCTSENIPSYMLDSELFVFQTLKPGVDGHATCISNWFISSRGNNPVLKLTRNLLYKYWDAHDEAIDYFIFHHFFQLATEVYPDEWNRVVPYTNETSHNLLLRLFDKYDPELFRGMIEQTCFHKLTYKFTKEQIADKESNYAHIMKEY